jgi:mannosylglycerate hydrolase
MRNLHIISHTHWDREWYLPFQSFRLKLVHLIDGLLELLEEDPQFKYYLLDGQTIVLDDYLALRPDKEAILRQYIQKGRIIIGPWHILPDMFLVGFEAHIRNLLQGERTARKFGPKMQVGYIPDPFGHPGQIPQLLRGFGIEAACLWRGLDDEPAEFWWQSPDGSHVLMVYLRDSYANGASLPADDPSAFAAALDHASDSLAAHSTVSDYLIMYGNDHMEPPPGTSWAITYANKVLKDTHVVHSTLPKFVAAIQADIRKQKLVLPTVIGELRACRRMHLLPGVLSTRMWIKQRNHASENLLTKWVEPFSTFASLMTSDQRPSAIVHGQSSIVQYPSSIVRFTWRLLMENHPHDSICGCSIDQVHDEMKVRFDQVDQIGEELASQSLEAIANAINTSSSNDAQKSAILVFNPTSFARSDFLNLSVELPPGVSEFDLVDEQGISLPYQAQGIESRELVHMILDAKGLQSAFGSINDGRAAGMTIQDVRIIREASQVYIDAIMAYGGEPNLAAWEAGRKQVEDLFSDQSITSYHVHARSSPASQVTLTVPQVPGLGYRTLWLRPRAVKESMPVHLGGPLVNAVLFLNRLPFLKKLVPGQRKPRQPQRLENEFFLVTLEKNGTLDLLDKRTGQRFEGLNRFLDGGDCGDEYDYSPPNTDRFLTAHLKRSRVESGPVQQSLSLELQLPTPACLAPDRKSRSKKTVFTRISSRIALTSGVPRVDISTTVENLARDHRLRVHFPAPFSSLSGSQDGQFEVVERPIGLTPFDQTWVEQPRPEVPQRAFTDISDGKSGLMLANRGLPEVEVLKNSLGNSEIALTLLRCVGWLSRDDFSTRKGHAGPFMETPGAQMPGEWTFEYSIVPHSGDWQSAFQQAYAFETPLRAVTTSLHGGVMPPTGSFVESSPETFIISAIKTAEDGRGWLVRGYNITNETITVTLKSWKPFAKVELVNLAEETQSALKPDKTGCVILQVHAHEIVSMLFQN